MKEEQIKIYVINLKKSIDRRKSIEDLMNQYSIDFEFFEGVDGSSLSIDIINKARERSKKWYQENEGEGELMKVGEIGAALSHYNIYQKIISENLDLGIIMEDDVNFDERFKSFIKSKESIRNAIQNFDLILLGYSTHDVKFDVPALCSYWGRIKISKQFKVGIPLKWYWSAIGYIINQRGAKLLSAKQGEYPCVVADILTANSPQYSVKLGVLTKPIVWPGTLNNFSTIQVTKKESITKSDSSKKSISKKIYFDRFKVVFEKFKKFLRKEKMKMNTHHYLFKSDRY